MCNGCNFHELLGRNLRTTVRIFQQLRRSPLRQVLPGGFPTHVYVKGLGQHGRSCLNTWRVGGIPENKGDDLLGRHFPGDAKTPRLLQSAKVETDDVAGERSRE
jgi:hypothetical protein